MSERTYNVLYEVSEYGSGYKPIYVFPAMQEAREAQKKVDELYKRYNKCIMDKYGTSGPNVVMYRSLVSTILIVPGSDNFEIERCLWRQEPVSIVVKNLNDRLTLSLSKKDAEDIASYMNQRVSGYKAFEVSISGYLDWLKGEIERMEESTDDLYI